MFDQYCIKCHNGEKEKPKLNLTLRDSKVPWRWNKGNHRPGETTPFKEPYVELIGGQIGWGRSAPKNEHGVAVSMSGCLIVEGYSQGGVAAIENLKTLPPKAAFSHRSKIVKNAISGKHHNVKVDPASLRRLIAWVDCNGPYLGEEEIREMYDPVLTTDDIGAVEARVRTAPEINRFNIRQDGDSRAIVGEPVYSDQPVVDYSKPFKHVWLPKGSKVITATYGAGKKHITVTDKMQKILASDQEEIHNYNKLFGDPVGGTPKVLKITYECKGKKSTLKIPEDTRLVIRK